jgi:pimeloyl-ACP methyl ester carboxylesterase
MRKGARRTLVVLVVVVVLGMVGVDHLTAQAAYDALSNRSFQREHTSTPLDEGIAYQDVGFESDGLHLVGWWMPANTSAPATTARTTILLVHGHSAEMSKIVRHWGKMLHDDGYSILAFDLRNHGASDDGPGHYVTYGVDEAHDVLAAMAWVRAHAAELGVDGSRIVLYGESMGAASVLNAAGTHPAGLVGVISDSAYASFSYQSQLDGKSRGYPAFLTEMVVDRMDLLSASDPTDSHPDQAIAHIDVPVLLMHCLDDGRLSATSLDILAARAAPGTETWKESCASVRPTSDHHVDGYALPSYRQKVTAFLARVA